jgi:MYXO-CTERM domain-containing protein
VVLPASLVWQYRKEVVMKAGKGIIGLVAVLGLVLCAGVGQSGAAAILGGQLYTTGSDVQVTILDPNWGAEYLDYINLYEPASLARLIGSARAVDTVVDLGTLASGQELVFGVYVVNTGYTYRMGDGSRNPDGLSHALVDYLGAGYAVVGFDDLFGKLDGIYDANFLISGVTDQAPTAPVPLASTALLFAPALGGLAAIRRRYYR